jgi:para-aminobenzoate synthetase component I
MTRGAMIEKMNRLGKTKTPFFFMIDFDAACPVVFSLNSPDPDILFDINGFSNCSAGPVQNKPYLFNKFPMSFENYKNAFDIIQNELTEGNSFLLNLTFPTPIKTDLTLEDIFYSNHAKYRLLYRNRFTVFSPESFVKVNGGRIRTFPMKGTISANTPDAEKTILSDEKETAEHITIVDLLRNDLSIVAKNVEVEKFRYIDRITTSNGELLQVSSVIAGCLDSGWHESIGSIISALLPAGSVTGAPKKKTVEIIRYAENYSRGFYTGVFGCYDGESLDSGVMIRFIEQTLDGMVYKSGGGITIYSDAVKEYNELIEKVYVPFN